MKKLLAIILTMTLVLGFAACSKDPEEPSGKVSAGPTSKSEKEPYTIAYSCMSLDNSYFVQICKGAEDHAKELGIKVKIHDGKLDVNRQISAIETWIEEGVDAICITPVDPVALEPYVTQAQKAGIPVIGCNQPIKGTDAFVTIDEYFYGYLMGQLAAEYINANLSDLDEVNVIIFGWPMIEVIVQRTEGCKAALKELAPKAKVIAEPQANTAADGMAAMENMLQVHDTIHVVIGNDSVGVAASEAIRAADRKGIVIIGQDCTPEALDKIREHDIYYGTVDIMPYKTGAQYIDTAIKVIKDGPIAEPITFDHQNVTWDNVNELYPK